MKVDASSTNVQLNTYLNQVRNQQQASSTQNQQDPARQAVGQDKVELSDRAKEVQQASQVLKSMPDTRADMVSKTRLEVTQGTYKVNGTKVAAGMLKESFENDTILQKIDTKA